MFCVDSQIQNYYTPKHQGNQTIKQVYHIYELPASAAGRDPVWVAEMGSQIATPSFYPDIPGLLSKFGKRWSNPEKYWGSDTAPALLEVLPLSNTQIIIQRLL